MKTYVQKLSLALLSFIFTLQQIAAQWSENATSIWNTTLGKNVGIGTKDPTRKLEVNGDINLGIDEAAVTGYGSRLYFLGASLNSDPLWMSRYNNGANSSEVRVNIGDDADADDRFVIGTHYWRDGIWRPHLTVQASGNIGIGTTNPTQKLSVNGTIQAKEIIVNTGWSDFVFDNNYKLHPLTEVEQFVKTNKHLPEIPSQKEVEKNGVQLGDISSKLLMKIEELTLYMIEMNKRSELQQKEQQKEIEKQKAININLENQIKKLQNK